MADAAGTFVRAAEETGYALDWPEGSLAVLEELIAAVWNPVAGTEISAISRT